MRRKTERRGIHLPGGAGINKLNQDVITLAAAAEADNAIAVTIQVNDYDGDAVTAVRRLVCHALKADFTQDAAALTLAETGAGAEVSTTAKASLYVTTNAAGLAVVTVTDVTTALAGTAYLRVEEVANEDGAARVCLPSIIALTFA